MKRKKKTQQRSKRGESRADGSRLRKVTFELDSRRCAQLAAASALLGETRRELLIRAWDQYMKGFSEVKTIREVSEQRLRRDERVT